MNTKALTKQLVTVSHKRNLHFRHHRPLSSVSSQVTSGTGVTEGHIYIRQQCTSCHNDHEVTISPSTRSSYEEHNVLNTRAHKEPTQMRACTHTNTHTTAAPATHSTAASGSQGTQATTATSIQCSLNLTAHKRPEGALCAAP